MRVIVLLGLNLVVLHSSVYFFDKCSGDAKSNMLVIFSFICCDLDHRSLEGIEKAAKQRASSYQHEIVMMFTYFLVTPFHFLCMLICSSKSYARHFFLLPRGFCSAALAVSERFRAPLSLG